jgi:hypothetical protein
MARKRADPDMAMKDMARKRADPDMAMKDVTFGIVALLVVYLTYQYLLDLNLFQTGPTTACRSECAECRACFRLRMRDAKPQTQINPMVAAILDGYWH